MSKPNSRSPRNLPAGLASPPPFSQMCRQGSPGLVLHSPLVLTATGDAAGNPVGSVARVCRISSHLPPRPPPWPNLHHDCPGWFLSSLPVLLSPSLTDLWARTSHPRPGPPTPEDPSRARRPCRRHSAPTPGPRLRSPCGTGTPNQDALRSRPGGLTAGSRAGGERRGGAGGRGPGGRSTHLRRLHRRGFGLRPVGRAGRDAAGDRAGAGARAPRSRHCGGNRPSFRAFHSRRSGLRIPDALSHGTVPGTTENSDTTKAPPEVPPPRDAHSRKRPSATPHGLPGNVVSTPLLRGFRT